MSAKRPQPRPDRRASAARHQMENWEAYGCEEAYRNSTKTDAWSSQRNQAIVFGARSGGPKVSNTMRVLSLRPAGLLVILLSLIKRVV